MVRQWTLPIQQHFPVCGVDSRVNVLLGFGAGFRGFAGDFPDFTPDCKEGRWLAMAQMDEK
jgi:hypothetical protein